MAVARRTKNTAHPRQVLSGDQQVDPSRTPAWSWMLPFGVLVLAIVAVPVKLMEQEGLPRYRTLSAELSRVQEQNAELHHEVSQLLLEVDALRTDPKALERIARHELGMIYPGELVFQFPER